MRRSATRPIQYVVLAIIALASLFVAMKAGRIVSDGAVLAWRYGPARVSAKDLTITDPGRLQLRISNGDVLGSGYAKVLGVIWGVITLVVFFACLTVLHFCLRRVAPRMLPAGLWDKGKEGIRYVIPRRSDTACRVGRLQ